MKPTIGRIVHYIASGDGVNDKGESGVHYPAIVCAVNGDSLSLVVFGIGAFELAYLWPVKEGAELGTWHWPEREE